MTMGSRQARVDNLEDDPVRILGMHWVPVPWFEPRPGAATEATWILRSWGPSRCADGLAAALRDADPWAHVTRVDASAAPDAGSDDLERVGHDQYHVLFLDETEPVTARDPADDESWAWAHAAVHACRETASKPGARLWIVTRTGLYGPGTRDVVRPEHDFARALGRCHAVESPESWGGLVDLDVDDPAAAGLMLAGYLLSGTTEDEILLRDDGPRVARLSASMLPPAASNQGLSMERLHIVSGGVAGLSFEIERWLARSGARRVLILGRSPLDTTREGNLRRLESLGCRAEYQVLDVGDPAAVRALGACLRERGEAVGGVFHLASTWRAGGHSCVSSLAAATDEKTRVLISAKSVGALLLGELAEEVGAEAMVLFSSAAATLGSPGQANYAAANAVLDGVARHLHRGNVRAVSIAWGPVGEVGFGATAEGSPLHDVWERLGLRRLTVDQVLSTVAMALSQDEPNLTVVSWDDGATELLPWALARPALESLALDEARGLSLPGLGELEDHERVGYIVDVLREHLARILSCAADDVDPHASLAALGIDSLIALELLFVVEREFAVRLGLDEVLLGTDASLATMAEHLDRRLRETGPETTGPETTGPEATVSSR
jgi:acyl carrier protein/NADP-dependent 3-hydroxy acid dehydrogenase YdfG